MAVVVERVDGRLLRISSRNAVTMVDGSGDEGSTAFRSVELLLASLGSCMIGTMLSAAEKNSIEVADAKIELKPVQVLTPERVSRIRMKMTIVGEFKEAELEILKAAAESCKVHNSLHHGIETELELSSGSPVMK